VVKEHRQKV